MVDMLSMIDAPCSQEGSILKFIQTKLNTDISFDGIGNLVAHKKGSGKKLMFYTSVDEDAFIVMTRDKRKVNFVHKGDKKINKGDLLSFNGYLAVADDDKSCTLLKEYDINTSDVGCFHAPSYEDEGIILTKEAASKLAISAMCQASEESSDFDVYFVFGVNSKMRNAGLCASVNTINPDELIIFEDLEKDSDKLCLKLMAKGFNSSRELAEKLVDKYDLEVIINSEDTSAGSVANCEKIAVVGIPVENKEFARQKANIKLRDDILNFIKGELQW